MAKLRECDVKHGRSWLAMPVLMLGGLLALTLSAAPGGAQAPVPATIGGCRIFPADNVWNTRIDMLPLDSRSAAYVNSIGAGGGLKADFGSGLWEGGPIGIPSTTAPAAQPPVPVSFEYHEDSDPGPYPIPPDAPIEGGAQSSGDRHVLVVQRDVCRLYETWSSYPQPDGSWQAGSGAVFDLNANALRPETWTSSDAAGLPVLPGLVRYDEVAAGRITHALRFTAQRTRRAYVWPARHYASSITDPNVPPMGQRFRLKADFDISAFSPANQVILRALKEYGMFLADNGSNWFVSGAPDERWNNSDLALLRGRVRGADFEAVDQTSLIISPDSAQARQLPSASPGPSPVPSATPRPPDANGDGVVDSTDALCILRQTGALPSTAACPVPLPNADVNTDQVVNAIDALCVLRYLGGFPPSTTCPASRAGAGAVMPAAGAAMVAPPRAAARRYRRRPAPRQRLNYHPTAVRFPPAAR